MAIDFTNISDTLGTFSQPLENISDQTPISDSYVVTDKQLRNRKIIRILFLSGVLLIFGIVLYKRFKKTK